MKETTNYEPQHDEQCVHFLLRRSNIVILAESAEKVRCTLGQMSPNDRLLIVLKYVEQYEHKEIAKILGCSEESSRSRLVRAKKLFREMYGEME